jgi:hypothetical protein
MTSITDVYNKLDELESKLDQLHADLSAEIAATNAVDATLQSGFTDVTQGIQVLANLEHKTNDILLHIVKQDDTIICELEHISKNTCEILNEEVVQTRLLTRIRDDSDAMRDIIETVNPAAAIDRERRLNLQAEIERCCPPESEPPACTYKPCAQPEKIDEKQPSANVPVFQRADQKPPPK